MVTQQITLKLTTNRTHEAAQQRGTLLERGKAEIPPPTGPSTRTSTDFIFMKSVEVRVDFTENEISRGSSGFHVSMRNEIS